MSRLAAWVVAAASLLAASPVAGSIVPSRGMYGATLGESRAAVAQTLGAPEEAGEFVDFWYERNLTIVYDDSGAAISLMLNGFTNRAQRQLELAHNSGRHPIWAPTATGRAERLPSGIGLGSKYASFKRRFPHARRVCGTADSLHISEVPFACSFRVKERHGFAIVDFKATRRYRPLWIYEIRVDR